MCNGLATGVSQHVLFTSNTVISVRCLSRLSLDAVCIELFQVFKKCCSSHPVLSRLLIDVPPYESGSCLCSSSESNHQVIAYLDFKNWRHWGRVSSRIILHLSLSCLKGHTFVRLVVVVFALCLDHLPQHAVWAL